VGKLTVPESALDPNIIPLVHALNAFTGIETIGSCGGHPNPNACQAGEGEFEVTFDIGHSDDGLFALEFLVWAVNNNWQQLDHWAQIVAFAAPPYLNLPGETLHFTLEGEGSPEELASYLDEERETAYIAPAAWYALALEDDTDVDAVQELLGQHIACEQI
jgi:hypothetical protein